MEQRSRQALRGVSASGQLQLAAAAKAPPRIVASLCWALLSTLLVATAVWLPKARDGRELDLIRPGAAGPSRAIVEKDFPHARLPAGLGHDGQQFYAVARGLPRLRPTAQFLDGPRYRMQRIGYPLLVRALHPQAGGGLGLVRAMILVNLLGIVLLGAAAGVLSAKLGGQVWVAAFAALLPGSLVGILVGTPEALAVGAALAAMALSLHNRHRLAVSVGVLAVLTREAHLLLLLGFALWRRDREGLRLAVVPALVLVAWGAVVRHAAGAGDDPPSVLGFGWTAAAAGWRKGPDLFSLSVLGVAAALVAVAVTRQGIRTPLGAAIALQLGLLVPLHKDVVAVPGNLARVLLPITCLALVVAVLPVTARRVDAAERVVRDGQPPGRASST